METPGAECTASPKTSRTNSVRWSVLAQNSAAVSSESPGDLGPSCPECRGVGVLLTRSWIVQRCDTCQLFIDDVEASLSISDRPIRLVCPACSYWEMSITSALISCPE